MRNLSRSRSWLALTGLLIASWAGLHVTACDDIECALYAQLAVEQNEENIAEGCGYTGPRWSSDFSHHMEWCMANCAASNAETLARAAALEACGASPKCVRKMNIRVELQTITVQDEADGSGNAEPYLWPIFFRVDIRTLGDISKEDPSWIYAPGGSHGNIGGDWDEGDTIPIPQGIGAWMSTVSSLLIPKGNITVGAIVVLLEEDDLPSSSDIEDDYYPEFADTVQERIRSKVLDSIASLLSPAGASGGATFSDSLEQEIGDTITGKLSEPWWAWLLSVLSGQPLALFANIDDFIGAAVFTWTWKDLEANPVQTFHKVWNDDTGSEDGDFTIYGRIQSTIICN